MLIHMHVHITYIHTHTHIHPLCQRRLLAYEKFITGQNEREESTQNTTVTNSAAYASYKIKATTGVCKIIAHRATVS
jgi:hypothetical protein